MTLLERLRSEYAVEHRCDDCSGIAPEIVDAPFCPACGYPNDAHLRASECPSETEVREWWGR